MTDTSGEHLVIFDGTGEPLLDGTPLHAPAGEGQAAVTALSAPVREAAGAVDQLVFQLDSRLDATGEHWDLWRTASRRWVVRMWDPTVTDDPAERTVNGATITEALTAAAATRRLPVIPRRPRLPEALRVRRDPTRSGRREVVVAGDVLVHTATTKRAAGEFISRYTADIHAAIDGWERQHACLVAAGVEGQDFYWSNR